MFRRQLSRLKIKKNQKNSTYIENWNKTLFSTRLLALFFCFVFLASLVVGSYNSIVLAAPKQNKLPGSLSTLDSSVKPAVDAQKADNSESTNAALNGEGLNGSEKASTPGSKRVEIVSKRTVNTETFDRGGGRMEVRQYLNPIHYKTSGSNKWEKIDTSLIEDANAADSTSVVGNAIAWVKSKTQKLNTYKVKANDWQARFAASDDPVGMVRIEAGDKKIRFTPRNVVDGVTPNVATSSDGIQTVTYTNLWPFTDVVYTVKKNMLKEEIILKNANADTSFAFDISGANLIKNQNGGFDIEGTKQQLTELSVTLRNAGPTSEKIIHQSYKNGVLTILLDQAWLKRQSADAFPIIIDPSYSTGPTIGYNYAAFKSDGYVCSSSVCYMNAGQLYDNGWKNWRTVLCTGNISFLVGKRVTWASLNLRQANRSYLAGYSGDRIFWIQHANSFSYQGMDGGAPSTAAIINYQGYLNMTDLAQFEADRNDPSPCWSMWGEVYGTYGSYKGFDPDLSYMYYEYSTTPATPTVVSPQNGQTFTDPQVSFQVNPVGDADGDPVQYKFTIATGADGYTGTVIDSGDLTSTQWTVPDGVLQDGTTYYLRVKSRDPYAYSAPSGVVSFKIDMRRGNDKTQSADTVGPVSVDLATGNVSTSISSHDTTALGGNLGISLDYNSPVRSRQGLVGRYWNNSSRSGDAVLTRVDKNINFNWDQASYSAGQSLNDYSADWSGYFVAPVTGNYVFGGSNDDKMTIYLGDSDQVPVYDQNCYSGTCYGSGYTMQQGQVVRIHVLYSEATGAAYAKMYVKGPVAEQVVPSEWLQTGARSVAQTRGLTGRYYAMPANGATPNLDAVDKSIFLSRVEPVLNFNWGTGSPITNGPVDFMSRWEGYLTVPKDGDYEFSTLADDGTKINIDGVELQNSWGSCCSEKVASVKHLNAGTQYYLKIDHYDGGGPGSFALYVRTTDNSIAKKIVPTSWLSPSRQVLPDGWKLGIDPDGDLSYERLNATTSSVILSDSSGDTHTYTLTASGGYTPPVNEDGQLTRNADGTFTLIDTDGKTYNFNVNGELGKVTMPTDDRKPAALQYTYDGGKIAKIADGIDTSRYAEVLYSTGSVATNPDVCKAKPDSSFDDAAPLGMICAVRTSDGRVTNFYYASGNLARVSKPGNESTDYRYDTSGLIIGIRDSVANDAIAASAVTGRSQDDTTLTQLGYDAIGRVSSVTAPAATAGAVRQQQTIEYLPYAMPLISNYQQYYPGDHYVTTGSGPVGFTPETWLSASLLLQQLPGTHPLYGCKIGWDQFVSTDSNCEGQTRLGLLGYAYDTPQPNGLTVSLRRCTIGGEHFVAHEDNCGGFTVEGILGYGIAGVSMLGQTKQHIVGDTEPNGYTRKIEYDATFRTTRDTDVSAKDTYQQWDPIKDLLLSTTDATGLKSTTIYNANDMPTDSYGPAPSTWFGADRKPLTTYVSQVPHTSTTYDDNLKGLSVAWFDYKNTSGGILTGAPRLHTYSLDPTMRDRMWIDGGDSIHGKIPITKSTNADAVGLRATGKFIVPANAPANGTYSFNSCHDDALRLTVNDQVVINDWSYRGGVKCVTGTPIQLAPGSYVRYSLEYANADNAGYAFSLDVSGAASTSGAVWGDMLKPDYGLQTSQTVYGAPTNPGATATLVSRTDYGTNPELGLAQSATTDATGIGLIATSTYETQGADGSYLRQTSSSLPGGATTNYSYYGATETKDNPCTEVVETYHQGGMLRLKTEPDPDGSGTQTARTVETIYDDAGKVVATRYNSDPWTCTTYDARERVLSTIVPAYNDQPARIITNNYAVGGNPLITSSSDSSGTVTVEVDLLGRNVKYTDTKGNVTTSEYDSKGHLVKRTSGLGIETYGYDNVDRLTDQKLDGVTFAHVNYDGFSRITSVQYPAGMKLDLTRESDTTSLGRLIKRTYTLTNGQTLSDEVTRAVTGDVTGGTELGQAKSYSYDTAGRLTAATVAGNTFTYGYGSQDASCAALPGANVNAGKDSNRTSQTVNGITTTYCYDQADRLIASSNPLYDAPTYDTHGNTTRLGTGATTTSFTYDSSDRNVGITQSTATGSTTTTYDRDVQGRLLYRHQDTNGSNVSNDYYGYTASGDSPDFITDVTGTVTEKYLSLPGGVKVTIRPQRSSAGVQTFSLPNIHSDIFATVDADGKLLTTQQTGPFGEQLSGQTTPWNTLNGATLNYVGSAQKLTEAQLQLTPIQMGARVYIPGLGRFLQVDPVQGGTANNYVYVVDPINDYDLNGTFSFKKLIQKASYRLHQFWAWQEKHPKQTELMMMLIPGGKSSKGMKMSSPKASERIVPRGKVKGKVLLPTKMQFHPLDNSEIKILKRNGYDPEQIKKDFVGKGGAKYDLFKNESGDISVRPKFDNSSDPGEPIGLNIKGIH